MKVSELVGTLFQLDKDWTSRIVMAMLIMGVLWGLLGMVDSLMIRVQETGWGVTGSMPFTPQEYYAGITLHAERALFGFTQQVIYAIFIFFTIRLLKLEPRAKWVLNVSFILINMSMMFMEGPILVYPIFNDNYFPATGWYYLSPLGLPGHSSYVVSPLFFWGWVMLDAFTYLAGGWIVYHYYLATRRMRERLPVALVFFLMDTLLFMIGYSGVTAADVWDLLAFYGITGVDALANQVAFWIFGHAVVYMLWLPAVGALYLLIPTLAGKPLYSDKLGRISALLYLVFSNVVPIHHLYMVNLPVYMKFVQEILTYGVVNPSMMTFFNLWATAKEAKFSWNVVSAFTVTAFAGAIAAGVTGISNATISFDAIVHNTMWVVGHFHAMILLSIVPAAMAVVYFMIPMLTGRNWYSKGAAWFHFWGYLLGSVILVVGMDQLGLGGLLRRSEIFPRTYYFVSAEVEVTVGMLLAQAATLAWLLNLLSTLVKGRRIELAPLDLGQTIQVIGVSLSGALPTLTSPVLRRAISRGYGMGVLGALIAALSFFFLAKMGDGYGDFIWIWLLLFITGVFLMALPILRDSKGV